MVESFENQVAIVTGAGRGLGRSYALDLARRGAVVVVNDINEDSTLKVLSEIESFGGKALGILESVTTEDGGQEIANKTLEKFNKIDVLIHNAGTVRSGFFGDLAVQDIDAMLDVHLRGGFFVAQPAYCAMKDNGYGRIVFISSTSGIFGTDGMSNYSAAKAGLFGLCNALALEGRGYGILANCVLPKARTDFMAQSTSRPGIRLDDALEERRTAESVAPLVTALASRSCAVTGEVFSACLGRYARVFIGVAPGWLAADANAVTAEDILEHFDEVEDHGYRGLVPRSVTDELIAVEDLLRKSGYLNAG